MCRKYKWLLWALFAGWTLMIFTRSMQSAPASTQESVLVQKILEHMFRVDITISQIRKTAHFIEFAVLGVLAQLVFGGFCRTAKGGIAFSIIAGLAIALCDETIQLFAAGRSGEVRDVCLDLLGAVTGALIALVVRILIRRTRKRQ